MIAPNMKIWICMCFSGVILIVLHWFYDIDDIFVVFFWCFIVLITSIVLLGVLRLVFSSHLQLGISNSDVGEGSGVIVAVNCDKLW